MPTLKVKETFKGYYPLCSRSQEIAYKNKRVYFTKEDLLVLLTRFYVLIN